MSAGYAFSDETCFIISLGWSLTQWSQTVNQLMSICQLTRCRCCRSDVCWSPHLSVMFDFCDRLILTLPIDSIVEIYMPIQIGSRSVRASLENKVLRRTSNLQLHITSTQNVALCEFVFRICLDYWWAETTCTVMPLRTRSPSHTLTHIHLQDVHLIMVSSLCPCTAYLSVVSAVCHVPFLQKSNLHNLPWFYSC